MGENASEDINGAVKRLKTGSAKHCGESICITNAATRRLPRRSELADFSVQAIHADSDARQKLVRARQDETTQAVRRMNLDCIAWVRKDLKQGITAAVSENGECRAE